MNKENKLQCDLTPPIWDQEYYYVVNNDEYDENYISKHWSLAHKLIFCPQLLKTNIKNLDLNVKDSLGNTPLVFLTLSVNDDNVELISLLLKNGANPNIVDDHDWTPLNQFITHYSSANKNFSQYFNLLVQSTDSNLQINAKYEIISAGLYMKLPIEFLKILLDKYKYDLNYLPDSSVTLFTDLVGFIKDENIITYVQLLLDYGIDINIESGTHNTILTYAIVSGGNNALIQFLCENGANVDHYTLNDEDEIAENCLMLTIERPDRESLEILKTLLQYNADVSYMSDPSNKAFEFALDNWSADQISLQKLQLLVDRVDDVNELLDTRNDAQQIWRNLYYLSKKQNDENDKKIQELTALKSTDFNSIINNLVGSYL